MSERYLRLISFRTGRHLLEPAPGAPNNLSQRLVRRLKEWTGQPWLVVAEDGGGGETLAETGKGASSGESAAEVAGRPLRAVGDGSVPGAELTEAAPDRRAERRPAEAEVMSDDDD